MTVAEFKAKLHKFGEAWEAAMEDPNDEEAAKPAIDLAEELTEAYREAMAKRGPY